MKGAIAILVVLGVALSVVVAERNDVKYNKREVRNQIVSNLRKLTNKCRDLADKYIEIGDAQSDQIIKKAKLSVAAQLIDSIGYIRYVDILFACEELKGEHYQTELEFLSLEVYKIDTKVDANIQALVKLGEEMLDTTILKDVADIVRGIRDYRYFLQELSFEELAAIPRAA